MSDQSYKAEFERGGVWRRALALLIDVIAISAVLQLLALAAFPLSHGRVQFAEGLIYNTTCDKLEKLPDGVSVSADFGANSITDCRHSLFGLTSARILRISRITQDGAITKTVWIDRMLDADGAPTAGLALNVLLLPLLLALRFVLDRGAGSPGRRLCRIRVANAADGEAPARSALNRRYAFLLAVLCPALIWSFYSSLTAFGITNPGSALWIQIAIGLPALIVALQALNAIFWRKDAWYDRFAGTSVLRVSKQGEVTALPTKPPPSESFDRNLPQMISSEVVSSEAISLEVAPSEFVVPSEFGDGASAPISPALPPPLPRLGAQNYFARHWRGELSLPLSYWVNGTLGGFVAGIVIAGIGLAINRQAEAQPLVWLLSLCSIWFLIAVLAVWQVVGVWRSATHYQQSGKSFWGGAAKVLMVLGVLQAVFRFATVGMPQIAGIVEIVAGDSRVGPHQFRVLAHGEMLEFSGGITFGVAEEMEGFLNAMANVKTVRLNSIGGRILEAQKMSDLIKARRLSTFVEKQCLSACTIVFLGGIDRAIMSNARLGFHQPAFRGMTAANRDAAIAAEERRLQGFGLSRAFVERANSAAPTSMWLPDNDELLREHVVTRIVPLKPLAPKSAPPPVEAAPAGAVANATPATAAGQATAMPAVHPDLSTSQAPRAIIPADVIKRLTAAPKPKTTTKSTSAPLNAPAGSK